MADDRTRAALHQIAEILSVPVSVLHSPGQSSSLTPSAREIPETLELLEAFTRVTDPKMRHACIEFVRKAGSA
ncbi:hypothetical protein MKL09_00415 [Methylobacterium sp. J-048]|uniref:hypothetical protein n=1 Tax=unclassified Methylobacterium TaxID=2615210 RepID=UPI001FBA7930|nr:MULTISPECIES: hypothetical protein [unclassified Methylobacterium]MCJ2055025.1 hypothetical protein [Methylobacterium sp. J-048]MCJ2139086.1 hypothetical protein [Methylobacterium sp. E-066]